MENTTKNIKRLTEDLLRIRSASVSALCGYSNANYLVDSGSEKSIFKTYPLTQDVEDQLNAENEVLLYLNENFSGRRLIPVLLSNGHFSSPGIFGQK